MKRIINILISALLAVIITSCSEDFLTYTPSNSLDADGAYVTVKDLKNGLNGAYYTLGRSEFYGRNVVALGDIAADGAFMVGTSGHFNAIYKYEIIEQLTDLENIYNYGYKVLDRTTRVIVGCENILPNAALADVGAVNSYMSQAYALRALSTFALANIFCKPYSAANVDELGLVLVVDKPIAITDKISRATLGETYTQILADINKAKEYAQIAEDEGFEDVDEFYMNYAAIFALEARVRLFMADYPGAIAAANEAITRRDGAIEYNAVNYLAQWSSIDINDEDIFTISKTPDDNLSANSLNTLYGSYSGLVTPHIFNLFAPGDMRLGLFTLDAVNNGYKAKYQGIPGSAATSNIPVLRLPEMYLILAECYSYSNITEAQNNLLVIAKRNPAITTVADLPATQADLLTFIAEERQRELFQEGHRYYDMRRTGEIMNRTTGAVNIVNFDVAKFCYPIPTYEINASGIEQNPDWASFLPTM